MNPQKVFSSIALFLAINFILAGQVLAQVDLKPPSDSSYEAVLHVLLGSSDLDQSPGLPRTLSGVTNQLKSNFSFSNYKLVNTFLGRIADTGNLKYNSMANIYGREVESEPPSFLDWGIAGFRRVSDAPGRGIFQLNSFRFGARAPIKLANQKDPAGPAQSAVVYESIGVSLDKLSVAENSPALIGTLTLPKTSGTVFLVLTVKTLEN